MRRGNPIARAGAIALALVFATSFARADAPAGAAPATSTTTSTPDEFEARWSGTSFGGYLAPKGSEFIGDDGGVDLVFHFNAAMLADKSWRRSNARAVIVSHAFADFGTTQYDAFYSDPARFGRMVDEVIRKVGVAKGRQDVHVRRITLVGWSAGFAAVGKILGVRRYYDLVDSVVLLDGLHAQYKLRAGETKHALMGIDHVNVDQLSTFTRFARDAAAGKKQLIVTHTNIWTPDYATTAETTGALLHELSLTKTDADEELFGMHLRYRVDAKGLHVLGFRGNMPDDHMAHLYAVGDIVKTYVAPRLDRLAATPKATDEGQAGL